MAQTTSALSAKSAKVEISTNGSSWTDISGVASAVEPGTATRQSGEAYTFDGDTAIITGGKREPVELEVKIVYTEGASDGFEVVRAAFEAGTALYVRYSPKGGTTGNFMFTSDSGLVVDFNYPTIDAEEAAPILTDFTVKTAKVTKSVVA